MLNLDNTNYCGSVTYRVADLTTTGNQLAHGVNYSGNSGFVLSARIANTSIRKGDCRSFSGSTITDIAGTTTIKLYAR